MNYPYPARDAAWTPDAPDSAAVDSPSALIAAGQPAFDPTTLDVFDGTELCGARFVAVVAPSAQHPDVWQRIEFTCGEDAGHDPGTPHRGEYSWGDSNTLPDEPNCGVCADVGVTPQGEPCTCAAGQPFVEAAAAAARGGAPDGP